MRVYMYMPAAGRWWEDGRGRVVSEGDGPRYQMHHAPEVAGASTGAEPRAEARESEGRVWPGAHHTCHHSTTANPFSTDTPTRAPSITSGRLSDTETSLSMEENRLSADVERTKTFTLSPDNDVNSSHRCSTRWQTPGHLGVACRSVPPRRRG